MRFAVFFIFLFSVSVFAQLEGNPENWCRNGLFARDSKNYSIGKVKAKKGEKVYFYGDDKNCPNGKNCQQKAYLIAGNEVIVSRSFGKWACAWYQPKKGSETVGWLTLNKLEFTPMVQGIEDYLGKWQFYDNDIEIKKTGDSNVFEIKGNAFWKGFGDNIHIGELDGKGIWDGNVLLYGEEEKSEYACKVRLDLVWNYLIVSDNMNCGGANVTFSGVYRKKSTR